MGRRVKKYCLLDTAWFYHPWAYTSCHYLYKICARLQPIKTPVWMGEGLLRPRPQLRTYWQSMVLGRWLLISCPPTSGWPLTYAFGVSSGLRKLIAIMSWSQEGDRLLSFKDNWSEIVGVDKIKIYYTHVWNFQRRTESIIFKTWGMEY